VEVRQRDLRAGRSGKSWKLTEHWTAIEADFQAEYGIDLSGSWPYNHSWRRFNVLKEAITVKPNTALHQSLVQSFQNEDTGKVDPETGKPVQVIEDPEEQEQVLDNILGLE